MQDSDVDASLRKLVEQSAAKNRDEAEHSGLISQRQMFGYIQLIQTLPWNVIAFTGAQVTWNVTDFCFLRVQCNRMALSTDRSDVAISATRRDDDFFSVPVLSHFAITLVCLPSHDMLWPSRKIVYRSLEGSGGGGRICKTNVEFQYMSTHTNGCLPECNAMVSVHLAGWCSAQQADHYFQLLTITQTGVLLRQHSVSNLLHRTKWHVLDGY